jgi:hypothetical protein
MVEATLLSKNARCSLKKLLLVAVLAIVGAITGCGDAKIAYLASIQISPGTPSVAAGLTQQFTAQGTFNTGATRDLTSLVTWTSATPYVASIAAGGLANTYSQGSSTITASFATQTNGTITGTATITVAAPTLVSIVISSTPLNNAYPVPVPYSGASVTTAAGTSHQFLAYGLYSDGGERNITSSVTWSSSATNVATINTSGRAMGLIPGTATITAKDPTTGLTQNASLVVTNATVTAITVSPARQTIAPLTQLVFSALGQFSNGTTQDITADATWASTNIAVATVTSSAPNGVVTGLSAGSTVIGAVLGGVAGGASLTVSSASLVSIAFPMVSPATTGVAIGSTLLLNAVGTFSDGTKQNLNSSAAWTVTPSNGSIATVDKTGLVTGIAAGAATVKAQVGTVTQTYALNVQNLSSIAVKPASVTIAGGTATAFDAVATLADGTTQDLTSSVTWVSATPATATISNGLVWGGWASGIAAGTSTIYAVFSGQSGQSSLTVSSATLSSIAMTPATPQSIALGSTQQYKATATFSDSTTQDLTYQVTWTSSDPGVAVVNLTGLATSTGVGSTMVKASANINGSTHSDDKALIVTP